MTTFKIRVSERVMDKFLWLLRQFKEDEIEILDSGKIRESEIRELKQDFDNLKSGKEKLYSLKEADSILEETIKKYES